MPKENNEITIKPEITNTVRSGAEMAQRLADLIDNPPAQETEMETVVFVQDTARAEAALARRISNG